MDTAITQQFLNSGSAVNPWGTVNTEVTGNNTFVDSQGKTITVPKFTQTTTLSPEQQAIFNQSERRRAALRALLDDQSAFLKDYLNKPFEFNNQDAEQWAFDLASPRIRGLNSGRRAQLRSALANKGIREGSAAWNAEMVHDPTQTLTR